MGDCQDILLTTPTNRTRMGPRLHLQGSVLTVDYDYEEDDGTTVWGSVVFEEVLSCQYCEHPCCKADHVLEPTVVRRLGESTWLSETVSRWETSVGWQEWHVAQGGRSRFSHHTMYFDDAGAVDVIARAANVG